VLAEATKLWLAIAPSPDQRAFRPVPSRKKCRGAARGDGVWPRVD
jgi:hypothetical protein